LFREVLNGRTENQLVITNLHACLVAFPLSDWRRIEKKSSNLSIFSEESRAFQRFFISGATECTIDRQGRILVPPSLREFARLEKDVALVGMLNSFEIWNKQIFEEEMTGLSTGAKRATVKEEMIKLGL